jgi:hypothetical protein
MAAFHAAFDSGSLVHAGKPARIQAITPEGDSTPLAMTLGLIKDDSGKVSGAVGVLRRPTDLDIFA